MGGKSIIIAGILYLIGQSASGQSEWPLQHIDKTAGLSNSAINSIYLDQHDYAWFGTWDGLNRYDGDQLITYKPITDDPHSISNNVIRQILEDKRGNLWIVTHDGINRYDRKSDRFHRYLQKIDHLHFLENNLKAALSSDSSIYISLTGWGVGKYSPKEDRFIRIKPKGNSFENIHSIGTDDDFLYLMDNEGGLYAYDEHKNLNKHLINWSPNYTFRKFLAMNDKYFFAYQKNQSKLVLIELHEGVLKTIHELDTRGALITEITQSKDKKHLYLGTDEGELFQIKQINGSLELKSWSSFLTTINKKKLKIFSIHESKQDILWVGTDGDGVYKYLTKERSFYSIGDGDASEGKLSNSIVRSINMNPDGDLYIGTRSGGLNVMDRTLKKAIIYDKTNGLSDNTVLAIANDSKGNTWLGLDGEGLDMIEKSTGKIFHFPRDFSNLPKDLYFGSVYKVFFDAYGRLWLGTSGHGIVYLDIQKDKNGNYYLKENYSIVPETVDGSGINLKSNIIYTIVQEDPNILWFGTRNGGLYRYNTLARKFTHHLKAEDQSRSTLSNNDILSLYIDRENKLWVGTSGGLNKVNLNDFTVVQYTQNDGLGNNTIHGILQDEQGKLWLSSNNGLFAFSPQNNTFKNFNWRDGLLNDEYTDGAYFTSSNGNRLFFGGTKGLDIITPNKIDIANTFPRLALSILYISNVQIKPEDDTGILQSTIDLQDHISLRYDQNFLSLQFTTLDYWHKQRCSYRYYLEGFDKDWITLGKQSDINLTNIPPGDYMLHLNNTNENGDWNPEVKQLSIHIAPPFWLTNTAYLIYVLLALLIQIGFIRFLRIRAKRKKAEEMDRMKKEQADIIQKYKLEFFTDIAHEFRTPLTLILGPAASLLEKTVNNATLNGPLQSIYRNSLRLQKLIQELIQFRKVELGKEKLRIRSLNLSDFVEKILKSFRQYALEKEIVLSYESPEKSLVSYADPDILEKILINLVSNALKYTGHGGTVNIKVWLENFCVYFSVSDTGIGIHPHELSRIFNRFTDIHPNREEQTTKSVGIGLSLTNKLIRLHKGEISVKSVPNKGSVFTFWLPASSEVYDGSMDDQSKDVVLDKMETYIMEEFYPENNLNQEMINIRLERFDHNILILDDSIQILNLLKDLLSKKYNVIACSNAPEALTILSNRKIDLVISDVIMPEMNGYEFCREIKNKIETSHIPVILLTAKGDIEERIEGLQAGADAYIPKPFHPDHLYVRIEKLISTRELLRKKFDSHSISENGFSSFGIGSKDDEFFKKLDQFIKQEMGNAQLDAQHLANHLGMSKTSLYKKVRALTGQTPHGLINHYRLKKAAQLLTNSDHNVSEIIYITGFNSRSYFYKSFQEMFHCSPLSYNKEG